MFEPAAPADAAVSLDNSPELAMPALHRAAIGPISSDYYLPIFSRFEAAGEATLSWNGSACLYSLNWLIFRGLWGLALVFAVVMAGVVGLLLSLNQLLFDWPPEVLYGAIAASLSLVLLVLGAWGNALFFNHGRKAMMAAIEANPTLALACAQLERQASSRARFIRLLVANGLLLAAAALAYVLLPGAGLLVETTAPAAAPTAEVASASVAASSQPASAVAETASVAVALAASEASAAASESAATTVADAATPQAAAASEPASAPETAASQTLGLASTEGIGATVTSTPMPEPALSAVSAARASKAVHAALKATSAVPVAAPTPEPAASTAAKGFFINAGLFAQADNARNTLAKLQAAGLPAYTQDLQTSQGPRTRVRVGPFAKRTQAEAAIKKIHTLKLDAALVKP